MRGIFEKSVDAIVGVNCMLSETATALADPIKLATAAPATFLDRFVPNLIMHVVTTLQGPLYADAIRVLCEAVCCVVKAAFLRPTMTMTRLVRMMMLLNICSQRLGLPGPWAFWKSLCMS